MSEVWPASIPELTPKLISTERYLSSAFYVTYRTLAIA